MCRPIVTNMERVRLVAAAVGLALAASSFTACASRAPSVRVEPADARDWRRLDEAARWQRAGRLIDAMQTYKDVAAESGHVAVVREALLQAALIQLTLHDDLPAAQRMLREARTAHPAGEAPAALTASMRLVERLIAAERAVASAAGETAALDEELRTLRRNVTALKQQVDRREDALKKAAQAVVGPTPQR